MILVDVHCHLNHTHFKDQLDAVIERARKAGVRKIIVNGVNPPTNREALQLSEKYDIVECALGAYPGDALNVPPPPEDAGLAHTQHFDLDEEIKFITKNKEKITAVGEVGLDFKMWPERAKEQQENFQKIIDLSKRIKKPLIIHTRGAEQETIEQLESNDVKNANLHSFGGKKSLVKRAADDGYHLSIPSIVKRLRHFEMVIEHVPLKQLLTETDAPWLSSVSGEHSEPAHVIESVKKIAQIKKLDQQECANAIYQNYQRLFG